MDEVSVYSRALSSNEIAGIYAAGNAGKCLADTTGGSAEMYPQSNIVRYEIPARAGMPPVTVHVHQNLRGDAPYPEGMAADERLLPRGNNLAERGRYAPPEPTRERASAAGGGT